MTYDSLRADPRPIFHVGFDDIDPNDISIVPDGLIVAMRVGVFANGVEIVSPGFDQPGEFALQGGERFFSIPEGDGPLDVAVQLDLSDQLTGVYPYRVSSAIRNLVDTPSGQLLVGNANITSAELLHVNAIDSPFGSGWGIDGLLEIFEGPDGSVAIVDGDGSEVRFTSGARQVQDFLAPDVVDESIERIDGVTGGSRGDFVQPGAGGLNNPHNPTFGPDGHLYVVSDSGGPAAQILRFNGETGEFRDVFVDTGEGGYAGAAEQAFDADGNLYLATASALGVLRFDRFGNFIDSIAGPADGVQAACGIEIGPDGLLYVWDTADEEMHRFDPATGNHVDVFIAAGNMFNACDFDFGTDGDIFITDLTLSEIRRFSGVDGNFLGTFANTNPGASGITFGPDGNFYANIAGNTHRFDGQTGEFIDEFLPGTGGFNNFFPPPPDGIDKEFLNPAGDFSTLELLPDGTYRQTTPDQTVLTFNDQNKIASIVDRNGNTTTYVYDVLGNITTITDPVGLETTFAYEDGRVSTITDPASRETILEYDTDGNLTRITDPDGTSRSFQYDARHLMTGETDKRGNQEFAFYDQFGRATRALLADSSEILVTPRQVQGLYPADQTSDLFNRSDAIRTAGDAVYTDANGNQVVTELDEAGQRVSARDDEGALPSIVRDPATNLVTQTTDARGNIAQLTYDQRGNLTSVVDSINSVAGPASPPVFTYDPVFNQLTSATDELGRQTLFEIDPNNGNTLSITKVIGPVGGGDDLVTQFTYTPAGLVDTITDPLGRVADVDYDPKGRATSVTVAVGTIDEAVQRFEYDVAGNVTAFIDEEGNRTEFEYDALARFTRIVEADPDGIGPLASPITMLSYDNAGNLVSQTDARNVTTVFEYDALNRQTRIVDALSNVTRFSYDGANNLVSMIDPLLNEIRFEYDARNRLVTQIDPNDGVSTFEYDGADNLTLVRDPSDNVTRYTYDARNRLTSEIDHFEETTTFTFDATDNLVATIDRNGRVVEYAYDDVNRLLSETWVGGNNVIEYTYDDIGNVLTAADNASAIQFIYDNRDRVLTVDNDGTPNVARVILTYTYDDVGNVLSVTDSINSVAGAVDSYQYDDLNRPVTLTQSGSNVSDKRVDFSFNAVGQFETITRFSDLSASQMVVQSTYQYDAINRLESLTHSNAGGAVAFTNLSFDAASRITTLANADGTTTYNYDSRSQLVAADRDDPTNSDETYTYDANGNRQTSHLSGSGYVIGEGNRLHSDGTFDYAYDNVGNLILRTEIATGDTREFAWDFRNRLISIIDKDSGDNEIQRVEFSYDAFDRRISKSLSNAVDDVLTHFVYDRDDVRIDFVDPDGAAGVAAAVLSQRYLHGPAVDQVLAQEDGSGDVLWHLADHVGTVSDLVDNTGSVVNHIKYDSYGNVIDQSNSTASSRYLFAGREFDSETGLYYNRARFYDSTIGRFISQDPIGFGDGLNRYVYAGNNPVSVFDPTGQAGFGDWQVGVGKSGLTVGPITFGPGGVVVDPIAAAAPKSWIDYQSMLTKRASLLAKYKALAAAIEALQKDKDKTKNCPADNAIEELRRKLRDEAIKQLRKQLANLRTEFNQLTKDIQNFRNNPNNQIPPTASGPGSNPFIPPPQPGGPLQPPTTFS